MASQGNLFLDVPVCRAHGDWTLTLGSKVTAGDTTVACLEAAPLDVAAWRLLELSVCARSCTREFTWFMDALLAALHSQECILLMTFDL